MILALQSRQVFGYSLSDRVPGELVLTALRNAWHRHAAAAQTIFHSDRGNQYASDNFGDALEALQMTVSMSRKGNCWDAIAESFFATLKSEEITEPYENLQAAQRGIASFIDGFYDPVRLHSSLGYLSPDEDARGMKSAESRPVMRSVA